VTDNRGIGFIKDAFRYMWDRLTNCFRVQEMFPWAYDQAQDSSKVETIIYTIRSDKDSHFTGAIANGNSENENLTGLSANKIRIKRVKAICEENWAFDVALWQKDTFQTADFDTDAWCGMVGFIAASGVQINSGSYTQYYYDSGALDITYEDLDGTFELHCSYVARDANKGADEEVVFIVDYEPVA